MIWRVSYRAGARLGHFVPRELDTYLWVGEESDVMSPNMEDIDKKAPTAIATRFMG